MPPPNILYLALKSILVNRLQKILCCSEIVWQSIELTSTTRSPDPILSCTSLEPSEIVVNRVYKDDQFQYVSAIALKLASLKCGLATELAVEITDALNRDIIAVSRTTDHLSLDRVWQNFTVQAAPSGWIYFKLGAIGLHEWLNLLMTWLPTRRQSSQNSLRIFSHQDSDNLFSILHTHARCCSLLRLGAYKQLIQLNQPDPDSAAWTITNPDILDWLNTDRQFRCTHLMEHKLISQIIDIFDELACISSPDPQRLWRLVQGLSQAFQEFYASRRMFGTIETDDRALVQARLGLVFITQALLSWILQDWLNVYPPAEL